MILKYKCGNEDCVLYDQPIADLRTPQTSDGKGRVCAKCQKPMKVAETISVSHKRGPTGRRNRR
jgi:hypothetical protein